MSDNQHEQSPVVDCRKCIHCRDVRADGGARCLAPGVAGGWPILPSVMGTCDDFMPAVSPPMSADREGPDAIAIMQRALGCLVLGRALAEKHIPNLVAEIEGAMQGLGSLITSEEARRARPGAVVSRLALLGVRRDASGSL